jgi:hypothetical protein
MVDGVVDQSLYDSYGLTENSHGRETVSLDLCIGTEM